MARGFKTGGRKKGSKNKRTLEREAKLQAVSETLKETLGDENLFDGDAHALLVATYKNMTLPWEMRLDAAKVAVRFEKPALASTDNRNTNENVFVVDVGSGEQLTPDEWRDKFAPKPATEKLN